MNESLQPDLLDLWQPVSPGSAQPRGQRYGLCRLADSLPDQMQYATWEVTLWAQLCSALTQGHEARAAKPLVWFWPPRSALVTLNVCPYQPPPQHLGILGDRPSYKLLEGKDQVLKPCRLVGLPGMHSGWTVRSFLSWCPLWSVW